LRLYLGLYIKMDLFTSISVFLGLAILLDVFGMTLPVLRQVVGVLAQPFFDAGVIVLTTIGIVPSPTPIDLSFASFLAEGFSAGLLPIADFGVGAEGSFAVGTRWPFHPGPLSRLE
jgi:hypothetical protein